uniref:Phage protein n=1 Tax=viral metagenome TaxID=1070528 RepID=A0A6H2A4I4_9ZZZZ
MWKVNYQISLRQNGKIVTKVITDCVRVTISNNIFTFFTEVPDDDIETFNVENVFKLEVIE